MRILYVGTHDPMTPVGSPWTTETVWGESLALLGHDVIPVDEESTPWSQRTAMAEDCDLFLWTSTWGYAERHAQWAAESMRYLNERMPTAALHLDRWWGLSNREHQLADNAMFQCRWVFTPDGDHDDDWVQAGIHHVWLPPGVYEPECVPGVPRDEWQSDVAFMGNTNYGHKEHAAHRGAMLSALRSHFGERVAFWPRDDQPRPFGLDTNDLMASVKVMVGDGWRGAHRYWSNRVFECVGRGGFMVHPAISGLVELLPEGMGVSYFPPGDWAAMCELIEAGCADDEGRAEAIVKGQAFVRAEHTYTRRMETMIETMRAEGAFG